MLDHECPNIQVLAAPLADDEGDSRISDQALVILTSCHPVRIDEMPVETFAEVLAPWLDLCTLYACLWCLRDLSSSELLSELVVSARLRLAIL
jgi:hypothetical protein